MFLLWKIEAYFYRLKNSEVSKQNSWQYFEQSVDLERERVCLKTVNKTFSFDNGGIIGS